MNGKDVIFILVILGLCFLFSGTPDVWDELHNMAMSTCFNFNGR